MITPREIQFAREHLDDDIHSILLGKHKYPGLDVSKCVLQIEGLRKMRDKIPEWYACKQVFIPSLLALEQASSQATALYKQRFCSNPGPVIDLTGGLGVDAYYFAQKNERVVYLEREPLLCRTAEHNFRVLGAGTGLNVLRGDAARPWEQLTDIPYASMVYADPSRREGERRLRDIALYSPDITQIRESVLERAAAFLVKISPLADISRTLSLLPGTVEVHVVSVGNECKELLFLMKKNDPASADPLIVCAGGFSFHRGEEVLAARTVERNGCEGAPVEGDCLYEPDVSLLKAGAFALPVTRFGVKKLHRNSHFYVSSFPVRGFPSRKFRIREVIPFTSANMKKMHTRFPQASITVRNFPLTVAEWRKKAGIADGGTGYLFGTTTHSGGKDVPVVIYATKWEESI
ncbi:MAG: SAM-dependent methyltransferase [Bacteroidales bacterium]|jgi:hypothetical protein|nr:SAM-dependent methyltransferase [Bacteroidales bacterium]NLH22950.1 SAM-dependent methyltransferase [Bacteroidales bacterium]HPJ82879.1 SAM-dependent methyltransferase [Bacteroidales bacterium]